jgi:hypothetical protein
MSGTLSSRYSCALCKKTFDTYKQLFKHKLTHATGIFLCSCGTSYAKKASLGQHILRKRKRLDGKALGQSHVPVNMALSVAAVKHQKIHHCEKGRTDDNEGAKP